MVSPAAGLTAIKTIPTIELILIVGMVLYIDNEFYVIQILESFYVEIIIFPVIFDGQTPMCWSHLTEFIWSIRPVKSITVESFHQDPESGSVPLKDLYRSTPTVAERKHAA